MLKKQLALALVLCFLTLGAQAQSFFTPGFKASWPAAEKPESAAYQVDRDEFLTRYGVNDTARAIINMYYQKRGAGLLTVQISAGVGAAAGAVARATGSSPASANHPGGTGDIEYPGWVYPAIGVPFSVMVFGLVKMASWNRLELYKSLRQYHEKKVLPAKVRHRLTEYLAKTQAGDF